jgi:hypothetical protein
MSSSRDIHHPALRGPILYSYVTAQEPVHNKTCFISVYVRENDDINIQTWFTNSIKKYSSLLFFYKNRNCLYKIK